jgi:hypothetical protein
VNYDDGGDHHVVFPRIEFLQDRKAATTAPYDFFLPKTPAAYRQTTLWAIAVTDRRTVGEVYATLAQVKALQALVSLSPPVRIKHGS